MATNAPVKKPDFIEQAGELIARFAKGEAIAGTIYRDRQSTIVLASAVLAVASELRDIHNVLADLGGATPPVRTMPSTVQMCLWSRGRRGWFGACGYEAPDDIDDIIAGQNEQRCPGCNGQIFAIQSERVA
jgi:hypothetical protein